MIDTHCHLYDAPLVDDVEGVLEAARLAGVTGFVVPGTTLQTSAAAVALAAQHTDVWAAVGIHPEAVDGPVDVDALARLARQPRVVAVGEIGLDRSPGKPPLPEQTAAFRIQVALARDLGKPILVHSRDAAGAVLRVLEEGGADGPGGVLHAWAGAREVAEALARLGFRFGVAGVVTRVQARRVRGHLASLPLAWLVLETDAPFIGTELTPKGRVSPANLPEIRDALADLLAVSPAQVARVTTRTARALLDLT